MVWWEKTVEYLFLAEQLFNHNMVIMPLAGNEEQAGDARLQARSCKWILLEFKRTENDFPSEVKKFAQNEEDDGRVQYQIAKQHLEAEDHSHHLVYGGTIGKGSAERLALNGKTYFSRQPSIEQLLESGKELEQFSSYVQKFTAFKNGWNGSDSGGGSGASAKGLSEEAYSIVAGLSIEKGGAVCMALNEFRNSVALRPDISARVNSSKVSGVSAAQDPLRKPSAGKAQTDASKMPPVTDIVPETGRKLKR